MYLHSTKYYSINYLIKKDFVCIIYIGDSMFEKFLGEVKGIFNIITIFDLVISILFMLIGIIFFANPNMSNIAVSIMTGIILIINGVSSIYAYIKRGSIVLYNNNLIYGIILILLGIISMFVGKILSIFLGIYFIVSGIQKINYGVFLKKFNESSWLITLVLGILFIVVGIISFFTSGDALVKVAGICTLGYGLMNFIDVLLLRRRSKYFIA